MKGTANTMTMGTCIKYLREQKGLSQAELGKSLNPPVNRAAINKWKTGRVENVKRNHIIQLAEILDTTPCKLMCFENQSDRLYATNEAEILELIQKHFGKDSITILQYFQKLNRLGKEKALENIDNLLQSSKYTEKKIPLY